MNVKVLLAAALVIGLSTPAFAGDDKGSTDQAATQEAPKEKKICRTETVTGSLVAKRRICMTKAEWDQLAQNTKNSVDKYTSRSSGIPGTTSNPAAPQ